MKKILLVIVVLFLLVFLAILSPLILGLFLNDIEPFDDSDLTYAQETVIPQDNAYFYLEKIEENLDVSKDEDEQLLVHLEEDAWDETFVENILAANENALTFFDAAAGKNAYQEPAYADLSGVTLESMLPTLTGLLAATRLNTLEALSLSKRGEEEAAFEELFEALDLAQTLQSAQGTLIYQLLPISSKKVSLEALQRLAVDSALSSEKLSEYALRLENYSSVEGLIQGFKGEYFLDVWMVDFVANEGAQNLGMNTDPLLNRLAAFASGFYFHPNETKLRFANYAREGIKNLQISGEEESTLSEDLALLAAKPLYKLYLTPNAFGETLFVASAVNADGARHQNCEYQDLLEATKTALEAASM